MLSIACVCYIAPTGTSLEGRDSKAVDTLLALLLNDEPDVLEELVVSKVRRNTLNTV